MEEVSDRFVYFSFHKDGNIYFNYRTENIAELVLPRHPETSDLDEFYLQSMLKYFDPSQDFIENEILDAFPVISLTKNKDSKFYKLSIYRLREFYKGQIEEDEYIQASMKHLYMYSLLAKPTNKTLKRVIAGCLDKVTPVMYRQDKGDTVDYEGYELGRLASYVPTSRYRIMKLLRGWIEGALHFFDYSIMFFDCRFVGFDDFDENIIDLKTEDLFPGRRPNRYEPLEQIYASGKFKIQECGLYYEVEVRLDIIRNWLFTPPNNDNERDGKVMLFRNHNLKTRLEKILSRLFRKDSFQLNDVFKWNRYLNGGKFNSHYDTMFVQSSSEECSLYTLLLYLEVNDDSFMYLYGEKEIQVRLESNRAYIIPHWVKHRVEGKGAREFIKTEIVFKNKYVGTTYDQTLADAFDASCYYMLQSVRHPELKDIVSRNFNTINEARFYKSVYVPKLMNNIFIAKTFINVPFEYRHYLNRNLIKTFDVKFNFITDGTYYYFKIKERIDRSEPVVSRNEAIIMLSVMQLDINPKKMFQREVSAANCGHPCIDYRFTFSEFDIHEEILYWERDGLDRKMADTLQCIQYPLDMDKFCRVGNISVTDIPDDSKKFYFAACGSPRHFYTEYFITEMTSNSCNENYKSLNVDVVGDKKDIIKIRQNSFKNGITVTRTWKKRDI